MKQNIQKKIRELQMKKLLFELVVVNNFKKKEKKKKLNCQIKFYWNDHENILKYLAMSCRCPRIIVTETKLRKQTV